MQQIKMKPGAFVVFEGLDATGKSTQVHRLQEAAEGRFGVELFEQPAPYFTSQPSGMDALGQQIYKITEEMEINSPWCRQFLHLASHANHYQNHIIPSLIDGVAVFMDRCWWSTVAYGYFGTEMLDISAPEFIRIAQLPTKGVMPDVVFVFEHPWKEDHHNTAGVAAGYKWLVDAHFRGVMENNTTVVPVPPMGVEETTEYIFQHLARLDLTA